MQDFVEGCLSGCGASQKVLTQLELVIEEIFINIVSYAYHPPDVGEIDISCSVEGDRAKVVLMFADDGPEFDPLSVKDPDTTMKMEDRGLGIFLVKNNVDGITYRRDNGRNVLTVEKRLS